MIQWHGWATIVASPENRDIEASEEEKAEENALREVRQIVAGAAGKSNEIIDLRRANYEWHLWFAGSHNHVAVVVPVFEAVAAAAPGSYGLLYLNNDELQPPENNEWQVWVMKRGQVHRATDPFLSPFQPTVEDIYSDDT